MRVDDYDIRNGTIAAFVCHEQYPIVGRRGVKRRDRKEWISEGEKEEGGRRLEDCGASP